MSLVILKNYNNIGEALVAYSSLKAAGFHPYFENYHFALNGSLYMMALGGIILLIPNYEFNDAAEFLTGVVPVDATEFDQIPAKKFGMWKSSIFISFLCFNVLAALLALFIFVRIKYLILIVLGLSILAAVYGLRQAELSLILLVFLIPTTILLHAEYIAVPRLKKETRS